MYILAQNLMLFLQMAKGVDVRTWDHHLRAGHYSGWFRNAIENEELAREAAAVEGHRNLDPSETLRRINDAVRKRYTAPAHA